MTHAPHTLDNLTEATVDALSEHGGDPDWLRDRRRAALKRWSAQAWPDSRADEYWRSTPFHRLDLDRRIIGDGASGVADPEAAAAEIHLPASFVDDVQAPTCLLRMVDGRVLDASVPGACAEQGVILADLATAAAEHPELVEPHLGALTTSAADIASGPEVEATGLDEDRTVTANDAAWTAGAFVYVPDEVELDDPVGVHLHVSTGGAHLPRVLVVLGRHARATVVLQHSAAGLDGDGADALVDEVVEAVVGDGAQLDVVTLQEWTDDVDHLSLQKAQVHRDGRYRHLSVTVGGRTVRLRPEVDLVGAGASTEPLGVYFADEGQHFDLQPYIRHIAPHATSDVLFKGALQGRSRTVFRGNVLVGRDAVGTDTNETNRSLILTDGARADSTPFLEIFCADVTAGHGSATGQIDARHLFYLESRGIPRDQALRLIVFGFFREVLDRLGMPDVERRALAHIEREIELADLDRIGVSDAAPDQGDE